MNKDKITSQRSSFFHVNTKRRRIEEWIKGVNQLNKKSIYNLTWNAFYKELHKLGIKEFLKQYGYAYKKNLQLDIAKSNLWQRRLSLGDFEKSTELALYERLGSSFFDKVTRQTDFNPKNHPLSTIHYYLYHHSFHFAALSLGFANKQCFLNFFAQTQYVPECVENRAKNLGVSIESLQTVTPRLLRKELADLYDQPLVKNKNFIKYDFTLDELKSALENESNVLVVASLGGGNAYLVNKKLQTLRPMVNVCLQDLKERSWKELMVNTPILLWKIKLYQLFSNQLALDHWPATLYIPRPIHRSCMNYYWQFFTSQQAQSHTDTPLDHPSCASFYSTELVVSERLSACTFTA
ncbi:hypothetical protein [Rickettsiella endosymbiont of Miltochrista miniata]|uniref:hypothetical protein n=1 Tax=Rickettsiella endosymbiont of Miltochrista miniata TaxID=3066239 RepID=UPI00313BEE9B